jgi:hypothetical protein
MTAEHVAIETIAMIIFLSFVKYPLYEKYSNAVCIAVH